MGMCMANTGIIIDALLQNDCDNPLQRRAWDGEGSVMVAARSCMIADALTKFAALAGPSCQPLLDRFGAQALWDNQ